MGWEGFATFEEEINGEWVEFAQIDRRVIMPYKSIIFPKFAKVHEDNDLCEIVGKFYLRDLSRAPYTEIMNSTLLSYEEIMDRLEPGLSKEIKVKMINDKRIRVTVNVGH